MRLLHLHYAVEMSSTIRFDHGRVASPFGPRYKGHMARARHMLLALLAVIGIFLAPAHGRCERSLPDRYYGLDADDAPPWTKRTDGPGRVPGVHCGAALIADQ